MVKAPNSDFEPSVLVFFCQSCCGESSEHFESILASISHAISSVHFRCAREVTPDQISHGFANGADGILICGCLVRDCTEMASDLDVLRSLYRNQMVLKTMGLLPDRLREEWMVLGTTDRLDTIIADFAEQLKEFGPARLPSSGLVDGKKLESKEGNA